MRIFGMTLKVYHWFFINRIMIVFITTNGFGTLAVCQRKLSGLWLEAKRGVDYKVIRFINTEMQIKVDIWV